MKYNPDIHHRKSIRLKKYDYSKNGMYFITICTEGNLCILGKIQDGIMHLNNAGEIVKNIWEEVVKNDENISSHIFVIMPNHFHAIVTVENVVGAYPCGRPIGEIIGAFKSKTTNKYIEKVRVGELPPFEKRIWQRNFHDHIIRDQKSLENIEDYIEYNPRNWKTDKFFI